MSRARLKHADALPDSGHFSPSGCHVRLALFSWRFPRPRCHIAAPPRRRYWTMAGPSFTEMLDDACPDSTSAAPYFARRCLSVSPWRPRGATSPCVHVQSFFVTSASLFPSSYHDAPIVFFSTVPRRRAHPTRVTELIHRCPAGATTAPALVQRLCGTLAWRPQRLGCRGERCRCQAAAPRHPAPSRTGAGAVVQSRTPQTHRPQPHTLPAPVLSACQRQSTDVAALRSRKYPSYIGRPTRLPEPMVAPGPTQSRFSLIAATPSPPPRWRQP